MPRRRPAGASVAAILGMALTAASVALLALGGPAAMATTFDPCYGYDLCVRVHVQSSGLNSTGEGRVTSTPAGIDCQFSGGQPDPSTACDHDFHANFVDSLTITLHAAATSGDLVSCNPDLTPVSTSCDWGPATYPVGGSPFDTSVAFRFKSTLIDLSVDNGFVLGGRVTSSPSGIYCSLVDPFCVAGYRSGTTVKLFATPDQGYWFSGWAGACAGQGATCSLQITAPVSTRAVFPEGAPPSPTAAPSPSPRATPRASGAATAPPSRSPTASAPSGTPAGTPSDVRGDSAGPSASPGSDGASSGPSPVVLPGASATVATGLQPGATAAAQGPGADMGPIILAILGAGTLVALGLLGGAVILRRARDPRP